MHEEIAEIVRRIEEADQRAKRATDDTMTAEDFLNLADEIRR